MCVQSYPVAENLRIRSLVFFLIPKTYWIYINRTSTIDVYEISNRLFLVF